MGVKRERERERGRTDGREQEGLVTAENKKKIMLGGHADGNHCARTLAFLFPWRRRDGGKKSVSSRIFSLPSLQNGKKGKIESERERGEGGSNPQPSLLFFSLRHTESWTCMRGYCLILSVRHAN
jgi:hypothetical protein